ncbi:MAG TPA: type I-E CRISPR-associated protein Cse1/CasA [Kineosporiaceae bacterium]
MSRPWLRPVWLDRPGATGELVSLRDLLEQAHRIRRLVGDTPPQTIALYRLLLAIMHRVYRCAGTREWERLWSADRLPEQPLMAYLSEFADRFDLFDAERPFLQCPQLGALAPAGVAVLVPHRVTGNNVTLFDHTTAGDVLTVEPAEAARWLVTLQAYDTGGLKTPVPGGARSSESGLLNRFGCVLVEGANLKETLLLNLLPYAPERERPLGTRADDVPVWERSTAPDAKPKERFARGWTDVLTWSSRRVLLHQRVEDGRTVVDGVVVTPGTTLRRPIATGERVSPLLDVEHMAAFGGGPRTYGKKKPVPMTAVYLERHRGVWRHTEEFLLPEDERHQRPSALRELARRMDDGAVDEHAVYTLRVFGQQLDRSGGGTITAWFEQTISAPVALLRARSDSVGAIIGHAVALADGAGSALTRFERDFRDSMHADPDRAPRLWLDSGYWPALPDPFDVFLRGLASALQTGVSVVPVTQAWADAVGRAARTPADTRAAQPRNARQTLVVARCLNRFHTELDGLLRRFHGYVPRFAPEGEIA